MADSFAVQVTGLAEVQQMLREAPKNIVALGFLRAVSAGANVIADELERQTPIKAEDTGGLLDKGVLRESIRILYELNVDVKWAGAHVCFTTNNGADAVALWLDEGHRLVGHLPGKKVLKPPAIVGNGFVRKAADLSAGPAIEAVTTSLLQTVRQLFPQGGTP